MQAGDLILERIQQALRERGLRVEDLPRLGLSRRVFERIRKGDVSHFQERSKEQLERLLDKPRGWLFPQAPPAHVTPAEMPDELRGLVHEDEFFDWARGRLTRGNSAVFVCTARFFRDFYQSKRSAPTRSFRRFLNDLLDGGVACTWLFPSPASPSSSPDERRALEDAVDYYSWFVREVGETGRADSGLVRFMLYDALRAPVVNDSSGLVFLHGDQRLEAFHLLALDESGGRRRPGQLRLRREDANELWRQLLRAVIPAVSPRLNPNRIHSRVQENYRQRIVNKDYEGQYAALKKCVSFPDSARSEIGARIMERFRECPSLNILEIGAGNMHTSASLLYNRWGRDKALHVTAIDSGARYPQPPISIPGSGSLAYRSSTLYEAFQSDLRPELIIAFHSLYAADPGNLWKALGMLAPGGLLAILHSPYQDNAFSSIAAFVDAHLGKFDPYPGKVVGSDPFRIYGEDLRKHVEDELLVEMNTVELTGIFKEDLVFEPHPTGWQLTELGKQVVRFHGAGALDSLEDELSDPAWASSLRNAIRANQSKPARGELPQKEWLLLLQPDVERLAESLVSAPDSAG